jgi:hypothetical protein
MNDPIYKIKDWTQHFENSRSRVVENLRWVSVPNRHDGEGYSIVMEQKNAAELFAAWVLIIQVASKCKERGTLTRDDGTALTAKSLARKTKAPEQWFVNAFNFFTDKTLWLEREGENIEVTGDCHLPVTHPSPAHNPSAEGRKDRREEIGGDILASADTQPQANGGKIFWNAVEGFQNIQPVNRDQWKLAFPACDLDRQFAAMHVWLLANPAKAKKSNWCRFITTWLSSSQDRGGDISSTGRISVNSDPSALVEGWSSPNPQPDLDELFDMERIARERDEEAARIAGEEPKFEIMEESACF